MKTNPFTFRETYYEYISRFMSGGDCGHDPDGDFSKGNTCAESGGGSSSKTGNTRKRLNKGDVFEIKPGDQVYVSLPENHVYSNRKGVFDKYAKTNTVVGQDQLGFDTSIYAGKYVVVKASSGGGGQPAQFWESSFPDGWHVFAEKIGSNPKLTVDFYQSGSFTAMIKRPIEVIGNEKKENGEEVKKSKTSGNK